VLRRSLLPKRSAPPLNTEPSIRFPVTCPKCRQESLATLPLGVVASALIGGQAIRLHASCHDVYWDAHDSEIEQIREYMATPSLHALQANGDNGTPDEQAGSSAAITTTLQGVSLVCYLWIVRPKAVFESRNSVIAAWAFSGVISSSRLSRRWVSKFSRMAAMPIGRGYWDLLARADGCCD
jgi:hypothetical protein